MKTTISGRAWPILIALAVLVLALSGSQCARVGDQVTGPNDRSEALDDPGAPGGVSACVKNCNDVAKAATDAETDLHRNNIRACQQLRGAEKEQCLEDENARHDARTEEIEMAKEACKAQCHEQGSGSGGQ